MASLLTLAVPMDLNLNYLNILYYNSTIVKGKEVQTPSLLLESLRSHFCAWLIEKES
jgi:hypothetical protein